MSKKEAVEVKPEVPQPDMSTLLTALIALLAANRVADHREGRETLNPKLGTINAELAKALEQKDAKLSAAENAVKQSRREVQAAIAKANEAEVNLRDVKELSDFQI